MLIGPALSWHHLAMEPSSPQGEVTRVAMVVRPFLPLSLGRWWKGGGGGGDWSCGCASLHVSLYYISSDTGGASRYQHWAPAVSLHLQIAEMISGRDHELRCGRNINPRLHLSISE